MFNYSAHTDTQQQVDSARRVFCASGL